MRAIRVQSPGGPETLVIEEVGVPEPGPGQARIRIHFSGVNYVDTYQRTGLYPLPVPFTPGSEAAGVVEAVSPDVTLVAPGDRVAYAMELGSYAEYALVAEHRLVRVPDTMPLEVAAASMLQGMTAHYLATDTFALQPGHSALLHAAAGGVGLLLVQVARLRGARVIGTTSTEAKAEAARHAGAHDVVLYTKRDFREVVRELTAGRGVDVAYDSVGRDTFEGSLRSLRPRGMLVSYGQSSGPVPSFDPLLLSRLGSLYLTRPTLAHYIAEPAELQRRAGDVLRWIMAGELDVHIDRVLPLEQAAEAHRLLESRTTTGKLLLRG